MRTRITALVIVSLLACLSFAVPAARARGTCSLKTFEGTYVFYDRGSSSIVDTTVALYPLHWSAAIAPFVTVGEVTVTSEGVGDGFYWMRVGSLNGGFDPVPLHVTITEMNGDCTGKFSYTVPGTPPATIEERFILTDDGREFHSLPTSITNGVTTLVWIGTGHRIHKSSEPPKFCGPQTAQGSYLTSVENIVEFNAPTPPAFADVLLLRTDVSMAGDYTGTMYEKLGPDGGIQLPVSGTITVNPDCSFTNTLNIPALGASIVGKGVYFNEGKEYYMMPLLNPDLPADQQGIKYSFARGTRIGE